MTAFQGERRSAWKRRETSPEERKRDYAWNFSWKFLEPEERQAIVEIVKEILRQKNEPEEEWEDFLLEDFLRGEYFSATLRHILTHDAHEQTVQYCDAALARRKEVDVLRASVQIPPDQEPKTAHAAPDRYKDAEGGIEDRGTYPSGRMIPRAPRLDELDAGEDPDTEE